MTDRDNMTDMTKHIKIKKFRPNAKIPVQATEGSAGMDLYACIDSPITIKHGEIKLIPTGVGIALPDKYCAAFIYARSGLGIKHGICLANGVGVVDSDYRGEICVGLCNVSSDEYTVEPFERIAQMVIAPVYAAVLSTCSELDETSRDTGGFGSTGKK